MYIHLKSIRWKNFLSSGTQWVEVELDKTRAALIVGVNGSGKSTLLDALSFVNYGKPFRKVLKNQLLNTINNKDCVVEQRFAIGDTEYLIRRGIKPNIFELFRNEELINQDADSKEYQEYYEKHIWTIPFSAFPQVIALGAASFVPFMQLERKDRSKMIEGLLGTEIFTVMGLLLKEKVSNNKTALVQVDAFIAAAEKTIEIEKRRNADRQQDAEEVVKEKRAKVEVLDKQIWEADLQARASQSQADELREQLSGADAATKRLTKLTAIVIQLVAKRSTLKEQSKFFETNNSCLTCNQTIGHEHKDDMILQLRRQTEELDASVSDASILKIEAEQKVDEFGRTKEWADKFENSARELTARISHLQSLKRDIEGDIETIQRQTTRQLGEGGDLAATQKELGEYVADRDKLIKERNLNELASVLLKDTGIKTKIVKLYIPIINKLVNKYLAAMDFFINFELDENFQEKVKSRFRDEFSYDSFSEGEKARLDLALLFTWRAIAKMRNSASTNLLILDEVFDGSLDAQGNEELLKILHTLTTENNVFVISHKTDAFVDKFERVIRFEKHANFSRIVETT